MLDRRFVIGATLAGSMLVAATAFAQGQPIVGISTVTTYSADARITAVDPAARAPCRSPSPTAPPPCAK